MTAPMETALLSISVVIPTYNYADRLPRAVRSVVEQMDGLEVELLVVDDGSTDQTVAVLERLQAEYPGRLRVVHKANGGASSARNTGIRESSGRYLLFLDADDELAPGALAALSQHLREEPQTRLVIGGHIGVWPDGKRREHLPEALPASALERVRAYLLDKRIALSNGACLMHREIFERGDYPEAFRNGEDIPVFAQALAHYPCSLLMRPLALIHKHDDSLRHQFRYSKQAGLTLVDEIFSMRRLGAEFQPLKQAFAAQRCLSLFRSAYLVKDRDSAKAFFRAAVSHDWRVLFKLSYSRKALRLWLRKS